MRQGGIWRWVAVLGCIGAPLVLIAGVVALSGTRPALAAQSLLSTPGLVVTGQNAARGEVRLMLEAQTLSDGTLHGNARFERGEDRLVRLRMEQLLLRSEEAEADGAEGVGILGIGTFSTGEQVKVAIDLLDRGVEPYADRFRIRWRPLEQQAQGDSAWPYDSGWLQIHQVEIR